MFRSTAQADMDAFDRLPFALRKLMRDTVSNFSAEVVGQLLRAEYRGNAALAALALELQDRRDSREFLIEVFGEVP